MTAKKYDVVAIGELNVDLILTGISSMPVPGREILAKTCILTMGSSTAICAAGLASLGLSVAFAGKVGDDGYGRLASDTLAGYGVDMSGLIIDSSLQTGITVAMTAEGERDRAMVTYMGAIDKLTAGDVDERLIQNARHMHVGSFFLQNSLRPGLAELFRTAKEAGATTSLDAGWDDSENWDCGLSDVLRHTDIFFPNDSEAHAITGQRDAKKAAAELAKLCSVCAVKCGADGAVISDGGEIVESPAYDAKVVDTTGAGDSFNAGFLYGFLKGYGIKKAAEYGNACGSVSVTRYGGASASGSG